MLFLKTKLSISIGDKSEVRKTRLSHIFRF